MHLDKCEQNNRELLTSLRNDSNELALHEIAFGDWEKGRMSKPMRAKDVDTSRVQYALCVCVLACLYFFMCVVSCYSYRALASRRATSQTVQ